MKDGDSSMTDSPPGSLEPGTSTYSGSWDWLWVLLPLVVLVGLFVALYVLA